jgi:hypothetical protein
MSRIGLDHKFMKISRISFNLSSKSDPYPIYSKDRFISRELMVNEQSFRSSSQITAKQCCLRSAGPYPIRIRFVSKSEEIVSQGHAIPRKN